MAVERRLQRVQALGARRREARQRFSSAAKARHETYARRSGAFAIGRDELGHFKETRSLADLRIAADKWHVRMSFRREDGKSLEGIPWADVEGSLKERDVPRKLVQTSTHVVTAVRLLKHVRKSYERELAETDSLLGKLDQLNVSFSEKKGNVSEAELDELLDYLRELQGRLKRKKTAVKRIVGYNRLVRTMEMFESVKGLPDGKKAFQVARACAVFTSLRDRLGAWRDRQVAGIAEYTLQRECSLRVERDRWLFSKLTKFAGMAGKIYEYAVYDAHRVGVLHEIKGMLDGKEDREKILRHIRANSDFFRIREREAKDAAKLIVLMEKGIRRGGNKKIDFLIGHYRLLYRDVERGRYGGAKERLDRLLLFINAGKPRFIFEELSKEPDRYIQPVLKPLGEGLLAFEGQDFGAAQECFAQAAGEIRKTIYPLV